MVNELPLFFNCAMWGDGPGWGMMLFGGLWMVIIWALVIGAAIYLFRRFSGPGEGRPPRSAAIDILKERYARGDLNDEEFEARRQRIEQGR